MSNGFIIVSGLFIHGYFLKSGRDVVVEGWVSYKKSVKMFRNFLRGVPVKKCATIFFIQKLEKQILVYIRSESWFF